MIAYSEGIDLNQQKRPIHVWLSWKSALGSWFHCWFWSCSLLRAWIIPQLPLTKWDDPLRKWLHRKPIDLSIEILRSMIDWNPCQFRYTTPAKTARIGESVKNHLRRGLPCHHPSHFKQLYAHMNKTYRSPCLSLHIYSFCFPTWYLEWINTYGHGIRGWASGFGLSLSPSGCVQPLLVDDHRYHRASCYPLYSRHCHNSWTANPVSNQSGSNAMTLRVLSIAHLKWIIHPTKMFPQAIGIQRARTRIWQTQTGDVHLSAHNFCTPAVPSPWHKSPDHENLAPWGAYFGGRHQLTTYMALGQGPHQGYRALTHSLKDNHLWALASFKSGALTAPTGTCYLRTVLLLSDVLALDTA